MAPRRKGASSVFGLTQSQQQNYLRMLDDPQLAAAVEESAGEPLGGMPLQRKVEAVHDFVTRTQAKAGCIMVAAGNGDAPPTATVTKAPGNDDAAHPADRPPAPNPAAERARRYRARKRGDDVPKLKPGRKPTSAAALRRQIEELTRENTELRQKLEEAETVPEGVRRQRAASAEALAAGLLERLASLDPRKDRPAFRETLRDVMAAIDERHHHWPKT